MERVGDYLGVFLGTLESGNGVSPLLPLNMQNCQGEVVIWQPTERTEKGEASMFLFHMGIVDDRLNPQKSAIFL